jgi:hypothetical protein
MIAEDSGEPLHLLHTAVVFRPLSQLRTNFCDMVEIQWPARLEQARSVWYLICLVHLVCFVYLVDLVHRIGPVQPNKQNKPNNGLLTLADFFSILLGVRTHSARLAQADRRIRT